MLVAYWLPCELPASNDFACPPPHNATCYRRAGSGPQISVLALMGARFRGTTGSFGRPYLELSPSLEKVLAGSAVEELQRRGIRVVLTVLGNSEEQGLGWSCLPQEVNADFAAYVREEVIERHGLDGIDIDDEYAGCTGTVEQLAATAATLRGVLPDRLLSKALWRDEEAFRQTDLAASLDYGATMAYGYPIRATAAYLDEKLLPAEKLLVGVQAGPPDQAWMTSLESTREAAAFALEKNLRGMMLFSFTQDIQQFTRSPQHSTPWPAPDDHEWQRTMVESLLGDGSWVVDPGCRETDPPADQE